VTLSRVDGRGGIIEGEFSANVASPSTRILHLSKGQFRLKISAETIGKQQKNAQPGDAANRNQPAGLGVSLVVGAET
jgi:hypothetical protein